MEKAPSRVRFPYRGRRILRFSTRGGHAVGWAASASLLALLAAGLGCARPSAQIEPLPQSHASVISEGIDVAPNAEGGSRAERDTAGARASATEMKMVAPDAPADSVSADRGSRLTRIVVTAAIVGLLVFGFLAWVASGAK